MRVTRIFAALIGLLVAAGPTVASELVYRPINPSFGGDALNGNWLLSQATAQTEGGGSPGFSIDFPEFGGIPQPTQPTIPVPDVPPAQNPATP